VRILILALIRGVDAFGMHLHIGCMDSFLYRSGISVHIGEVTNLQTQLGERGDRLLRRYNTMMSE
jgi:hypothetical protein